MSIILKINFLNIVKIIWKWKILSINILKDTERVYFYLISWKKKFGIKQFKILLALRRFLKIINLHTWEDRIEATIITVILKRI